MNGIKWISMIVCSIALGPVGVAQNTGDLTISLTDIKEPNTGQLIFLIFDQAHGFPSEEDKALQKGVLTSFEAQASYTFKKLPFGIYAVSVFHDKNGNGEIDTNLIGIPKEPVGATNMTKMGRPNFNKCQFAFQANKHTRNLVFIND